MTQTLINLKTAQSAFKNLKNSTKIAMDDSSMGMNDKDQLIEQIFEQAEQLVDTAITAVETVESGTNNDPMGNMDNEQISTDTQITSDPSGIDDPERLNTANGMHQADPNQEGIGEHEKQMEARMQKMAQEIDDNKKELDEMKEKEAQMKLAQKYSELFPMAMRTAKFQEFMGHKAPTAVLEARLDEASVFMSKSNAVKFAQVEDSPFKFEDLESANNPNIETGGKI